MKLMKTHVKTNSSHKAYTASLLKAKPNKIVLHSWLEIQFNVQQAHF